MGSDFATGDIEPSSLRTTPEEPALPHPLTSICLCEWKSANRQGYASPSRTYLECIFPRKALFAMTTRKRLDREMDPFMSFQVVVSVEALRTLIALERPVVVVRLLRIPIHLLHVCGMATIESWHHTAWEASNECQLTSWTVYVGHCRAR